MSPVPISRLSCVVDGESQMYKSFGEEGRAFWADVAGLHPRPLPSEPDGTMAIATLHAEVQAGIRMVALENGR